MPYNDKGDYTQAEPLLRRALKIAEKTLGPDHPDVAELLNKLAILYLAKGDLRQAIAFLTRSNNIGEDNLSHNLLPGSERHKLAYLSTFLAQTRYTLSLHMQFAPGDPQARELALITLLQRKGRALDAMTDAVAALRRRAAVQDQALLDQLSNTRSQLAALTLRGPGKADPATYRAQLGQIEEQFERLEGELSSRS